MKRTHQNLFTGLGCFYQAQTNFHIQNYNLTSFNFEYFDYVDIETIQYSQKAIDYLSLKTVDFDVFNQIILLKCRYSNLKKDNISEIFFEEDFRIEDAKISKLILDCLKLLEDDNPS